MRKLILILSIFIAILFTSCSNTLSIQNSAPIYAMDTIIDITFYNTDNYKEHYKKIKKIYQDVDTVANDFSSSYNEISIYDLNQKREIQGNDILIDLINKSLELKDETNGYYNPFIGRLSHLWKVAIKNNEIVSKDLINQELEIMNNTKVEINNNTIKLTGEGNLDLGGIAKGYATQKAYEYLKENNITKYIINAGNSNIVFGNKNGKNFKVSFESPNDNSSYYLFEGKDKIISTSSHKYQHIIIDGKVYHHLLNPFTGICENYYDSVNVFCDNNMYADAYSTAFFVMDIDTIKSFIESKNIDVILYKDNNILLNTLDGDKNE